MKKIAQVVAPALAFAVTGTAEPGAESSAFADRILLGDAASGTAHALQAEGDVRTETLYTEMGGYRESYAVRTVSGKGVLLRMRIAAPPAGKPLLLEIREIHSRREEAFGYTVLLGGREIYFRTYEEYGAGPNHYFVAVPSVPPSADGSVELMFRSEGRGPFSLGAVWVYHDFFSAVAGPEQVYRPMGLSGMKLTQAEPKPQFDCFAPLGTLQIRQYGSGDIKKGRAGLDSVFRRDAAGGESTVFMVNGTAWGGKPSGPDGLGGYFSDPHYSSVSYDPETGRWAPSWPNMWGSTAWPTMLNTNMNRFLESRFSRLMDGFTERLDVQTADGLPPDLVLIREWGPTVGEVGPDAVRRARGDGLVMDPLDGLNRAERLWLYRDGVRLWEEYARSTREQVTWSCVRVDRGTVHLPEAQLPDRIFSQPDFLTDFPMDDVRWGGGQHGMVPGLWSSGEMGQGRDYRELAMYDYVRARGRLAMVNMERTILKEDFTVLKHHYAAGFQFVTFFNDFEGDERFIRAVDRCDPEPAPPAVHREPVLLAVDFAKERRIGTSGQVVAVDNLQILHADTLRIKEVRVPRLAAADFSRPGSVTYRIGGQDPLPAGLNLHLDGRIARVDGNAIEVRAGTDPEHLRTVRVLTGDDLGCPDHWAMHMTASTSVALGDEMAGKKEFYVQLVLHSSSTPDAAFLLSLHIASRWPRQSGYLDGTVVSVRENRIMQLWVQDRALALNLLDEYADRAAVPAEREREIMKRAAGLIERGWYCSAYALLCGEISQILPARYAVRGHGRLGCYPVEVTLPSPDQTVVVNLFAVSPDGIEFSVSSPAERQTVRLAFPALDPAAVWRLETVGPGHYRLTARPESGGSPVADPVAVEITVMKKQQAAQSLPRRMTGRFLGGDRRHITIDTQDLALMDFEQSMQLPVARGVTVRRTADCLEEPAGLNGWPQPLDQVTLDLDESGTVTNIAALYGRDRGVIKTFIPPSMESGAAGGIELENGRRYDFNFSKSNGTRFDTVALHEQIVNYEFPMLAAALKPGTPVELTYCPYAERGGRPRLGRIAQPYEVLLETDYTKTSGEEWKTGAVGICGADVIPHRPEPNYLYNVVIRLLRPLAPFQPGHLIYRIDAGRPLGQTVLEFTARAFEDSSRVEFLVSTGGSEWIPCGQFDNTWQNCMPQSTNSKTWDFPPQPLDLTAAVAGQTSFFLKVRLTAGDADDRFCVGGLKVYTATEPPEQE